MSDNIVFPCPACGTKYSVGPHHAGKKTTCKKCGAPITVPTPQVANPTLVGGTRTIRRADIDPGESTREEQVAAPSNVSVDMGGGASVLRKEETVFGAEEVVQPGTRGPTRRPTAPGPRPATGGRPAHGRPMPPGIGGPKKKNNNALIFGAVGGGLALILVIVLVIAFSGGPATGGTTGDNAAGTADGSGQVAQVDQDQRLLEEMQKQYNSKDALSLDQVRQYYQEARKRKDNPKFSVMEDSWARTLIEKAKSGATADDLADIAITLSNDKKAGADELLERAAKELQAAGKATRPVIEKREDGVEKKIFKPNPKFQDIVTRLGWEPYVYPPEMNTYIEYDVKGASEFSSYFNFDVPQAYRDVELFPPDIVSKLKEMQAVAQGNWDILKAKDDEDGFALKARKAWIRFKQAQGGGKVDRAKGKRSFSAEAMGRKGEPIEQVWTYTYWKPFMVYVEKGIGQDGLDEAFVETLESKAALLNYEYKWFEENLINQFSLQRQKPKDNAEQAEKEGWPLEIIVLKDDETFQQFCTDTMGNPIPGARAFYSPLEQRVLTFDDTSATDADTAWFNESVLIHETFHMLSDFYHANPIFDMEELQRHPSYANILVQEGLTDSVSGFSREGIGGQATYKFLQLNHLRLRSLKQILELLDGRTLFRIRDMLEVRSYGQAQQIAIQRAVELKINPMWAQSNALGIFYPSACEVSYFFQHYKKDGKNYTYRDKWWKYIGMDYKGEMQLASYSDNRAIGEFKKVFDIKTEADWDNLDKEWLAYVADLNPENVGKSAGGEVEGPDKIIAPDPLAPPPAPKDNSELGRDGPDSGMPGREDEDED